MHAVRIHAVGGPEVLQLEEVPQSEPGPGEALVRVEAIGVNFVDVYERSGPSHKPLPFIPGSEAAGVVDAVGDGVSEVRVGQRVAYAQCPGAYAEHTLVPAWKLVPIPEDVSSRVAAAVMLQGSTAHYLSHSTYALKPGDVALVHAAAGGAGRLLVQIARRLGARVIGTASTDEKEQLARSAGAEEVIRYTEVDFAVEARRLTDGVGVHVVYDSVGKDTFDKSLDSLRPRGFLVLFGQSSGRVPPLDPQVLNAKGSLFLTRPTLSHYIATRDELLWRSADLFSWIRDGTLEVRIDKTWPLAEAAEAHRYLEARQTKGKVLLLP
jgi:NADPH2:quinone reductase